MKKFMRMNKTVFALPIALAIAGTIPVFASSVVQGTVTVDNVGINAMFTEIDATTVSLGYGLGTDSAHTEAFTTNSTNEIIIPAIITNGGTNYNVTGVLQGALSDSTNATTITIGEGLTTISEGAFEGCTSVTTINLPSTLLYLRGHNPFVDCTSLTTIVYNGTEEDWNAKGFSSSYGRVTVTFSDNGSTDEPPANWDENTWIDVDGIDAKIRMNPSTGAILEVDSSVTTADIPEYIYKVQVKSIDGTAFQTCENLEFVSIPSGVTEIASNTFLNGSVSGNIYSGGKSLNQVCLPDTLTSIKSGAFFGSRVETIYIPSSVTSISSQALYSTYIGTILFGGTEANWNYATNNNSTIYNSSYTNLTCMNDSTEISLSVLGIVGGNITFDLETGIITGADASITRMVIPEYIAGVKVLGIKEGALDNCNVLTYVELHEDITNLPTTTFDSCSSLKSITYTGTEAQWIKKGLQNSYNNIDVVFLGDFDEDNWLEVDGIDAKVRISKSGTILEVEDSVTTADIPEFINGIQVAAIDEFAFQTCENLEFVSIPSGVTEIASNTFMNGYWILNGSEEKTYYYGGKSLKQVCLPDTLTKIGSCAFYGSSIEMLYIPSSVTSIGSQALYSSYASNSIGTILFDGIEDNWFSSTVGSSTVYNSLYTDLIFMNGNTKVSISVSGIVGGNITFDFATGMITSADAGITTAKIPEYIAGYKVKGIAADTFKDCTNLQTVILYNSIETIGSNAFPNTEMTIYFFGTQQEWDSLDYTKASNNELVIGKKDFKLGIDSNGYIHTSSNKGFGTDINNYRPQIATGTGVINGDDPTLTTAFINRLASLSPYSNLNESYFTTQLAESTGWGGSCFGVASTIGLVFSDYTTLDELSSTTLDNDQDTYYKLPIPVNNTQLYNSVMYYQVGQTIVSGTSLFNSSTELANAKPLLDALDKEQAVIFSYGYGDSGHAILALDYEQEADGSYTVKLFDENSYKGTMDSASFIDLTISKDYKTYSFTPVTGPSNSYDDNFVVKDILTNDPTKEDTNGYTEASYLSFKTLDSVYSIGPVYDSDGNFITGTNASTMSIEENNMESDTMLINIPMNSDITITIGDKILYYQNGKFTGDMTGIEMTPVAKNENSEWLLTVPSSDIVYVENNAPDEKDMNVEVFSDKGTLSVKANGVQRAILDLNEGIEVMLADGFNNVKMKNYFKIDDELVSVESIINDDTKLFIDDLTQKLNVVSIGDAEVSEIKNTLTGVSDQLTNKLDIKINSNEIQDFFSNWKDEQ